MFRIISKYSVLAKETESITDDQMSVSYFKLASLSANQEAHRKSVKQLVQPFSSVVSVKSQAT